ncbi:SRPBCC family protein [Furfurilactobacillus siliginis]|uniref:Polyketide cyclase n=1 Tax=Furfurilactobacillus siliginis TaxID=348151 RepID=A0A0R2LDK7_9LACO|nr:SRPBCC family protein [Furfurilactobacillus siliginis]KRN96679.1 hypothetical protein IV55_GL001211 [Furfurilactobacillus siliginis]GEK29109.1 hypothetical protein LSI01_14200 [Furfurilactobacillus siliginis]
MQKQMHFEIETSAQPEPLFDAVADMPNYQRWLPKSSAFTETVEVSPYPVQAGTTYLDYGAQGQRPGVVYRYEAPTLLGFKHSMSIKRMGLVVQVDVAILYHFEKNAGGTCVTRDLTMYIDAKGLALLLTPFVNAAFTAENKRVMRALKRYGDQL